MIATRLSLNLFNENLVQVLQDNRQPVQDNHQHEQDNHQLIHLSIVRSGDIDSNDNQPIVIQDNVSLNQMRTERANITIDSIVVGTNTRYNGILTNHYSSVAAAYQSLNIEYIRRLNHIYNRYLNDTNGRQRSNYYLSQLKQVYEQYLTEADNQYSVGFDIQEIADEINRFDNDFDISYYEPVIRQYNNILEDLFINSNDTQQFYIIYNRYSYNITSNQHVCKKRKKR